jgi:hypothetical protein
MWRRDHRLNVAASCTAVALQHRPAGQELLITASRKERWFASHIPGLLLIPRPVNLREKVGPACLRTSADLAQVEIPNSNGPSGGRLPLYLPCLGCNTLRPAHEEDSNATSR